MDFKLIHEEGKLYALIEVDGVEYRKDVTEYFINEEIIAEWLFWRRKRRLNRN